MGYLLLLKQLLLLLWKNFILQVSLNEATLKNLPKVAIVTYSAGVTGHFIPRDTLS